MKNKASSNQDQIIFTSATSLPFGTEFRIIDRPTPAGKVRVSIMYPKHSIAEISLQKGSFNSASFVVIKQSYSKSLFSCVASSSENIEKETRSIEDQIFATLSNLRKTFIIK